MVHLKGGSSVTAPDQIDDKDYDQSKLYRFLAGNRLSLTSIVEALIVAEHLSFRKASNALGIAQSAISARIASLEETLGVRLFERQQRVKVTLHGRAFLDLAAIAVDDLGRALDTTGLVLAARTKAIRIGLQSSAVRGTLADLLANFTTTHPDIVIVPDETAPGSMMEDLRKRKLDVLFAPEQQLAGRPANDVLDSLPLWRERLVVALWAGDPLAGRTYVKWRELAGRSFLVRRDGIGDCLMAMALPHLAHGERPPHIESLRVGRDTLLAAVARKRAAALTSDATLGLHIPDIVFRPIGPEPVFLTFHAVWSRQNANPSLHAFLGMVRKMAARRSETDSEA
jgi:DNA-binding transcriptional LysR family regulator